MKNFIKFITACFPRKPAVYFCLFFTWGITLWFLSSGDHGPKNGPKIAHIDKLYHFAYFTIGGVLFTLGGSFKWKTPHLLLFVIASTICSIIGRLDEYHQGFTPGRSGNDTGDWLADSLGGIAGSLIAIVLILPKISSTKKATTSKTSIKSEIIANSLD